MKIKLIFFKSTAVVLRLCGRLDCSNIEGYEHLFTPFIQVTLNFSLYLVLIHIPTKEEIDQFTTKKQWYGT